MILLKLFRDLICWLKASVGYKRGRENVTCEAAAYIVTFRSAGFAIKPNFEQFLTPNAKNLRIPPLLDPKNRKKI